MRAALIPALALILVACGDEEATRPAPTAQSSVVQVDMRDNRFMPRRLVVPVGTNVRWTNRDAVPHTVASQDLRLSSEGIESGEEFDYRPRRAGRFDYYCTIHAGQDGVLVVR